MGELSVDSDLQALTKIFLGKHCSNKDQIFFGVKYENGTFSPPILVCFFIEPEFTHFVKK